MVERPFPPPVRAPRRPLPTQRRTFDGPTTIALAILGAAALLVVGFVGYREFARQRDVNDAQQALQMIADQAQQAAQQWQAQTAAQQRAQQAATAQDWSRRQLAPDQECVGGAVVQVHGTDYQQIGSIQYPVHCAGRYADRPLR